MYTRAAWVLALTTVAGIASAEAQQPPAGPTTGSPTPGITQPDRPDLSDRITLTGCVRVAGAAPSNLSAVLEAAPRLSKFVLNDAKKESRVPAGTGTSSAAAAPAASTYLLEALDSQLSPFVGAQVEASGEVKTAGGVSILLVEFVQRSGPKCP